MHCRECLKYHLKFIFTNFPNKLIITSLILSTVVVVRFDRNSATFCENGGNQSIYVVLQDGQILQNMTVTIYDVDTSKNN